MKLSDAGPMGQQVLRIAALHDFWEHLASMEEKVYFEFEAEIQGEQTHFLIEVDKETEDPELRAGDFITSSAFRRDQEHQRSEIGRSCLHSNAA